MSDKISICKLIGQSNYEVWSLRVQSLLVHGSLSDAIVEGVSPKPEIDQKALANIRLTIEDGPLLQIQYSKTALEAWNLLKNLYSPKGFSSEFLICKELFETTLSKYSSMEEYLNKVKQLTDQLRAKGIALPSQVIVAWVLNNLTSPYEGFVTMVTQSYRTNSSTISLENLFSNLLDESRRQVSKDQEIALVTRSRQSTRPNQTNRIRKNKYCKKCKTTTHSTKDCFYLFPEKAPRGFKTKHKYNDEPKDQEALVSINTSDTISNPSNADNDFEIDLDLMDTDQVFFTNEVLIANQNPQPNHTGAKFVLDSGATKHVITRKEYFISYKDSCGRIGWGTDASIDSIGIGNVELVNKGNKIVLENCLHVPNFGYNLISVSKLDQLGYEIRVKNNQAHIYKNDQLLISAMGRNSLYYIDIVKNGFPSEKTNKVKETHKQTNKIEPTNKINLLEQKNKMQLWHQRMGHINPISLQKTLGLQSDIQLDECEICLESKLTNQRSKQITPKPKFHLEKGGN